MLYDIVILGGGPAGYEVALKAMDEGLTIAIVEGKKIGGTCLHKGCIPLKTLLEFTAMSEKVSFWRAKGTLTGNIELNLSEIINYKEKTITALQRGLEYRLNKENVKIYNMNGTIEGVENNNYVIRLENETIEGKNLVIATGSIEKTLNPTNIKTDYYIGTLDKAFEEDSVPTDIVIVGGGVIAFEIATYLREIGCNIIILEAATRVLGNVDNEIAYVLTNKYSKKGIRIITDIENIEYKKAEVNYTKGGKIETTTPEWVLETIGREANIKGIGLGNLNVQLENGYIKTDMNGLTSQDGVYACGDVTGAPLLAHAAYDEASRVVRNILKNNMQNKKIPMPQVIYTNPEVAMIGLTEEACIKNRIDFYKSTLPMTFSGRYLIDNGKDNALCKLLIDKTTLKIAGFHMIGNYASEIILAIEMAVYNEMTVYDLDNIIYPHPTVGEIIKELVNDIINQIRGEKNE